MNTISYKARYDALIVGARCAGAATAMLLARRGLKVLLIDRDEPGTDTMSTHALMRGAVMQLDRWGLLDTLIQNGTPPVRKTTFFYGAEEVPVPIKPGNGVDMLIAPRRTVLDATLVAAARDAGASVQHRTSLRYVTRDPGSDRVSGAVLTGPDGQSYEVTANLVVGADGRRSMVARQVGAETLVQSEASSGCIYAYLDGMKDDGYRWYYSEDSGAGAIPTNDGAHCVFAAVRAEEFATLRKTVRRDSLLTMLAARSNRDLGREVAAASLQSAPVLFAGAPGHMRQCAGNGWALVGDAGYFKDPITAHGITDALRDAEILANAVIARDLSAYQETRDEMSRDLFDVTDKIARYDMSMQDLQRTHMALNAVMKAEQSWMETAFDPLPKAA